MTIWLRQHRDALLLALRRLAAAPMNTLLSLLAIGVALALPAGGLMIFANAQQLVKGTSSLPQISVFMKLDADRAAVNETAAKLKQTTAIASVRFLDREATMEQMRKSEGLAEVIEALPRNPFPDAFVITPKNTEASEMERLATELRKLPQIEHVQIDSAWVRRLNAMLRVARVGLGILSLLLGIGLMAITFNTIRLQVLTLRNEIEVSRLLGATDAFISRPFFYFGTLQGMLGGVVAWLIVVATILALRSPVADLTVLYGLDIALALPDTGVTACLLAAAAGLGWLGTSLSLKQHLSAWRRF
ncbi:Cell division protein FtsX [Georgfuchsia toluolica]|uniref:Cell division protein FtsX n=1 Tax=Georgfuchsia toluolica TaxID=424218 RepID=A0A916J4J1_9PROT|nr:permease-like cell division protein FtsX [Georgfuchsia toluolica]CAG4884524.1 Cell division protein FtsX [Georgfuchsia toluolica]